MIIKRITKHPIFIYCIVLLAKLYCSFVILTSKIRLNIDSDVGRLLRDNNKSALIALWHGRMLLCPYIISKYTRAVAVNSIHKDGIYIERFIRLYGHQSIKGSSSKDALNAFKGVVKNLNKGKKVFITPDGPRGPKHHINGNIDVIAQKYNVPLLIFSISYKKKKELNSWDNFCIPLPFNTIAVEIKNLADKKVSKKQLADAMIEQEKRLDIEVQQDDIKHEK